MSGYASFGVAIIGNRRAWLDENNGRKDAMKTSGRKLASQ
jgi:hypothetical protein